MKAAAPPDDVITRREARASESFMVVMLCAVEVRVSMSDEERNPAGRTVVLQNLWAGQSVWYVWVENTFLKR